MLRQRSGLDKAELANLLGFNSERMLQKWEGGYSLPTAERLRQLIAIYQSKNVFASGKELEEARLLWNTIQNFYDTTHPSYEGYPLFDTVWFEKLLREHNSPTLRVLPPKSILAAPTLTATAQLVTEAAQDETSSPPSNLPAPNLTRFIGRQKELQVITALLTEQRHRLVTLGGPGGIGKTRLALEAVRPLLTSFKDGVWLVELAGVSPTEQLPIIIAKALDLTNKIGTKEVLAGLQKQLKPKQLLLLLDNCEHLVSECAELVNNLLTSCPQVQILTTSRERLDILGEVTVPVTPLSFPADSRNFARSELLEYDAVALFCNRAQLIEPNFELNELNGVALAQICQKLDGIPLALELAAVRVSTLSLEQINARLADRFKLLNRGNRTAVPRHQTLRTLVDWSFRLLNYQEQALFKRLAVFSGSWTLEAAEAVCSSKDLAAEEILDILSSLVAKSLVVAETQEAVMRYRMLQTIYEYACEHLAAAPDAPIFQEQHALYYCQLAEQAAAAIETPEQTHWLNRLEREHENFASIFNRVLGTQNDEIMPKADLKQIETTLRLAGAMASFWYWRGYGKQIRYWLEKSLEEAEKAGILEGNDKETVGRTARSLLQLAKLVFHQDECELALAHAKRGLMLAEKMAAKADIGFGKRLIGMCLLQKRDYTQATNYTEQSLAQYLEINHQEGIASATYELAVLAYFQNKNSLAKQYMQECIEIREKAGAKHQLGSSYSLLALIYRETGDYPNARYYQMKGITLCREINNRMALGNLLVNLGLLDYLEGNYIQAQVVLSEALIIEREAGNRLGVAAALNNLGLAAKCLGDYDLANKYYKESLDLRREIKESLYIATTLNYLGELAILQGDYKTARELLNSALVESQPVQHKLPIAYSYLYLGYLSYKEANYSEAKSWLQKAIEIYQERQNYHETAKCMTWLVCISHAEGNISTSLEYAAKLNEYLAATTGVLEPHYRTELGSVKFEVS
jgi:non-specific serine/threonine protein kinase